MGLTRDGKPKDLQQYINGSRNLVKYSKFDNFYQRTEKKYSIRKYKCITQADGSVIRIPWADKQWKSKPEYLKENSDKSMEQSWQNRKPKKIYPIKAKKAKWAWIWTSMKT